MSRVGTFDVSGELDVSGDLDVLGVVRVALPQDIIIALLPRHRPTIGSCSQQQPTGARPLLMALAHNPTKVDSS